MTATGHFAAILTLYPSRSEPDVAYEHRLVDPPYVPGRLLLHRQVHLRDELETPERIT